MINISEVIELHEELIERFGGSKGIRNIGLLESALHRPFLTFDGNELYQGVKEKAAVLLESIIKNHPFVDGNKRVGYVLFRSFLILNGIDITASEEIRYQLVINVAQGKASKKEIINWIEKHSKEIGY